jgi:hypothetical protein
MDLGPFGDTAPLFLRNGELSETSNKLSNHVKYIIKMAFRQVSVFRKLKLRVS